MRASLLSKVRRLGAAKAPVCLLREEPAVVRESTKMRPGEACDVVVAYGRARCRSSNVFSACITVLKNELSEPTGCSSLKPLTFMHAYKEIQAAGYSDPLLISLCFSSVATPSSPLFHEKIPPDLVVELVRQALGLKLYETKPDMFSRLLHTLLQHVGKLPARDIGILCEALSRYASGDVLRHIVQDELKQRLFDRATNSVVMSTFTVRELAYTLHLLTLPDFVAVEKAVMLMRLVQPAIKQLRRPYYEASLCLTPPECLAHVATALVAVSPDIVETREAVQWLSTAMREHYSTTPQSAMVSLAKAQAACGL